MAVNDLCVVGLFFVACSRIHLHREGNSIINGRRKEICSFWSGLAGDPKLSSKKRKMGARNMSVPRFLFSDPFFIMFHIFHAGICNNLMPVTED